MDLSKNFKFKASKSLEVNELLILELYSQGFHSKAGITVADFIARANHHETYAFEVIDGLIYTFPSGTEQHYHNSDVNELDISEFKFTNSEASAAIKKRRVKREKTLKKLEECLKVADPLAISDDDERIIERLISKLAPHLIDEN